MDWRGDNISSVYSAGICIFSDLLVNLSDDVGEIGRYSVMPGHIQMHGKSFDYIKDLSDLDESTQLYRYRKGTGLATNNISSPLDIIFDYHENFMVTQQNREMLQVGFCFSREDKSTIILGPSELANTFLKRSGLVACSHHSLQLDDSSPLQSRAALLFPPRDRVWIFQAQGLSKFVPIMQMVYKYGQGSIALANNDCRSCCESVAQKCWGDQIAIFL